MTEELEDVDVNIVDLLTENGYEAADASGAQDLDGVIDALEDARAARAAEKVADLYIPPGDKDADLERLDGVEGAIALGGETFQAAREAFEGDEDEFEDEGNFNRVVPVTEQIDLEDEEDSNLPSEALTIPRGAPRENVVAQVGEANGLRLFTGSDGRQHTETPRARQAFEDYYQMGRGRSLRKLAELYSNPSNIQWTNNFAGVHRKLQEYSANLDWQNRIRMLVVQESAMAIAAAQKSAAKHKRERIGRAVKMQKIGESILNKAGLLDVDGAASDLTKEEARQLIKPATVLLQVGMQLERAEIGESIDRIKPQKDPKDMDDAELEEWISVLQQELG